VPKPERIVSPESAERERLASVKLAGARQTLEIRLKAEQEAEAEARTRRDAEQREIAAAEARRLNESALARTVRERAVLEERAATQSHRQPPELHAHPVRRRRINRGQTPIIFSLRYSECGCHVRGLPFVPIPRIGCTGGRLLWSRLQC
jgi:hypothetical protein